MPHPPFGLKPLPRSPLERLYRRAAQRGALQRRLCLFQAGVHDVEPRAFKRGCARVRAAAARHGMISLWARARAEGSES